MTRRVFDAYQSRNLDSRHAVVSCKCGRVTHAPDRPTGARVAPDAPTSTTSAVQRDRSCGVGARCRVAGAGSGGAISMAGPPIRWAKIMLATPPTADSRQCSDREWRRPPRQAARPDSSDFTLSSQPRLCRSRHEHVDLQPVPRKNGRRGRAATSSRRLPNIRAGFRRRNQLTLRLWR